MYRQQLDAVLYSMNQYSWDAVSAWAGNLQNIVADRSAASQNELVRSLREFVDRRTTVRSVFIADTGFRSIVTVESSRGNSGAVSLKEKEILRQLAANKAKIEQLVDYQKVEYRKVEALTDADSLQGNRPLVLVFIAKDHGSAMRVVGMVLDPQDFVQNILSRKLQDAAGDEFILAVVKKRTQEIVDATSSVQAADLKQFRSLWLLPDYQLGIRLKGKTIDELVESRSYRNLGIIVILDIFLLAGAWLIYRTIRREMDLIQLRSDFVSNVSHELRTPLSLIRMFAETLEMKRVKTEKKKHEYYHTIIQESERLSRLVNNLLNFSRMEAGRRAYDLKPTDLNALVTSVIDFYTLQLRDKGFTVVIDLAPRLPAVSTDGEAIAETLHNIIDNAVKYTGTEKYLRIATGQEGGMAFFEVEDHGIGIAPEHQNRIFEKFYRVSTGLVHTTKGSGLGLALVRHIVDAHSGNVEVRSQLGKGSCFRVSLPVSPSS